MSVEKDVEKLTREMAKLCGGKNSAVVVAASLNMIHSCMLYGGLEFQQATADVLRSAANTIASPVAGAKH